MDLGNLTIQELLEKAQKYEDMKKKHNKNIYAYRERHPDIVKPKCALLAKKLYWRKKGFELNDLGEKIAIVKNEKLIN